MSRFKRFAVGLVIILLGCPSGPFGARPEIRNLTDGGEGGEIITLSFEISDEDLSRASVRVEYSTGDGWLPAAISNPSPGTESGNEITNLRPGTEWTACTVSWDSREDWTGTLPGGETATIRLTPLDIDGEGSPEEINIAVYNPTPVLDVQEEQLSFSHALGNVSNPADQTLHIENTGPVGTVLKWNLTVSYGPEASGWLSAGSESGTTNSGETTDVVFSADPAGRGLEPGTYSATVTVKDPQAHGSPEVVAVTLTVTTSSDLVGYWRFDEENASFTVDSSGNGNDGFFHGDPTWTAGKVLGALSLDGGDDYAEVPDSPELRITGDMTVALWVKKTAEASLWSRMVGRGGDLTPLNYGFWEESGAGGRIQFSQYDSGGGAVVNCCSDSEIVSGEWYHIAAVAEGANAYVYINGAPDGTAARSGTPNAAAAPVTIGYAGYASHFPGIVDEVRIYNRALSPAEIQSLAQLGVK